jgi:hypothetical protein
MVTMLRLLPRVSPRASKKLPKVRLRMAPRKKMPKLMLMLKELRCEGVKFIVLECVFVKTF